MSLPATTRPLPDSCNVKHCDVPVVFSPARCLTVVSPSLSQMRPYSSMCSSCSVSRPVVPAKLTNSSESGNQPTCKCCHHAVICDIVKLIIAKCVLFRLTKLFYNNDLLIVTNYILCCTLLLVCGFMSVNK